MEKQEKIVSMFNNIAVTYDIANRVLSMVIDKSWSNKACNKTFELYAKKVIVKIVDVACGTGVMILFCKQVAKV
ncbi:class I SAM-dependent methyltransferase, partial [Aliarcobacter butzleri]|uniref:class I SAM-dependent methyltransferase n=1 Tax=Aliarcobacter butzleri TaxID=28197 RepID=UPI003AF7BB4C